MSEQRMARVVVELVDTLLAGVDVIEFLQLLAERCLDVPEVDAAGVLLADERGVLNGGGEVLGLLVRDT